MRMPRIQGRPPHWLRLKVITSEGKVLGRPVGITVAKDGSLLIREDGDKTIWRVSYK